MLRALHRLVLALGGASFAAFLVAVLEARATAAAVESGATMPPLGAIALTDLGLLFPLVLAVGVATFVGSFIVEPEGPRTPSEHLSALREGTVLERLKKASLAPLVVFVVAAWCIGSAHIARGELAEGKPAETGLTVGLCSVGLLVGCVAFALAILPIVRRSLALGSSRMPILLDPAYTAAASLLMVGVVFVVGIVGGDTGGSTAFVGIFGVLKRDELDLRPAFNALLLFAGALALPMMFGRVDLIDDEKHPQSGPIAADIGAMLVVFVLGLLCRFASQDLGTKPLVARSIERSAPLGRVSLAILRKLTDGDKDGFSGRFGGGDCNDADKSINPGALDIPGNGIDEDCSGADTPGADDSKDPTTSVTAADVKRNRLKQSYNVILITVDTLRADLGFLGYEKPVSPNLDELALKSTVFERVYAMASYTGKSVGPMLIGRYPSETLRDGGHFNTYFPSNLFVTERLHDHGVRTFGGMCHWYFRMPTGLNQGMDVWDTSAIPPGMSDNDTSITSDRMSALAIKMLSNPNNVAAPAENEAADASVDGSTDRMSIVTSKDGTRRFFGWFHFFDPHAQYVPHPGAPSFTGPLPARNLYDQEVWFTDKHIGKVLELIRSQPWGAETAIVVTADHGEAFADHGMSWHGAEIWESLVRVPFIVYIPDAPARRVRVKRSHIDLAPTLLELMGVEVPEGEASPMRGESLITDVLAASNADHEERDVFIDMPAGPYNGIRRAIITGPTPGMKLIHSGGAAYQLYDLAEDPQERRDLSSDKAKFEPVLAQMQRLRASLKEIDVKPTN